MDNSKPNSASCTCGSAVCEPSINGPYCFAQASRCSCSTGSYKVKGQKLCNVCTPGKYGDEIGLVHNCNNCPSGRYSDILGAESLSSCKNCPKGRFSRFPGVSTLSSCKPCAKGSFADDVGYANCKVCPAGYIAAQEMSLGCTACTPGQFNPDKQRFAANHEVCEDCSTTGLPLSGTAAWFCKACPSGWRTRKQEDISTDVVIRRRLGR